MGRLSFKLEAEASGSRARAGRFKTLHNEVLTPLFMPVGTNATVKSQNRNTLAQTGSQILLANTYHLLLRPGPEVFRRAGGIHKFMNWGKSVLTDSGGFQIFSLPNCRTMTEEGAVFRSYVDGQNIKLTPELSIETQKAIGSDIMMVLDQCVPSTSDKALARAAMELTHRWAARSLAARGDSPQSLFGIVQGACFEDLRRESARVLTDMPFDGFAIGGLAVGETKQERETFCELTADLLPRDLPRYLMGVGTPIDLLEAVHRGVDMFDCILPTALAQQGVAYTFKGRWRLSRGVYKFSDEPLDAECGCDTCRHYSRGYLHHLTKAKEVLGWQLIGEHNLHFYHRLMDLMRQSILDDTFAALYRRLRPVLMQDDEHNLPNEMPPPRKRRTKAREWGDYEIHVSDAGFASVKQRSSGEVMHSIIEPQVEARLLYVEQSRLAEKCSPRAPTTELVLWDVGLGAATNAMAALHAYEQLPDHSPRPLHIVSFECDLDSLRLALLHPTLFPHLKHGAPNEVIKHSHWASTKRPIRWTLLAGDFLMKMEEAPAPDIIFYDPFSYKTDGPLWSVDCFEKIFRKCAGHETELYTYTASTAVRAALLSAGFYVAKGMGTGPKSETTVALHLSRERKIETPFELLSETWLQRWMRSDAKIPVGVHPEQRAFFEARVRNHSQFDPLG